MSRAPNRLHHSKPSRHHSVYYQSVLCEGGRMAMHACAKRARTFYR